MRADRPARLPVKLIRASIIAAAVVVLVAIGAATYVRRKEQETEVAKVAMREAGSGFSVARLSAWCDFVKAASEAGTVPGLQENAVKDLAKACEAFLAAMKPHK